MKKEIFRFIVFIAIAIIIKCVLLFKIMTMKFTTNNTDTE